MCVLAPPVSPTVSWALSVESSAESRRELPAGGDRCAVPYLPGADGLRAAPKGTAKWSFSLATPQLRWELTLPTRHPHYADSFSRGLPIGRTGLGRSLSIAAMKIFCCVVA